MPTALLPTRSNIVLRATLLTTQLQTLRFTTRFTHRVESIPFPARTLPVNRIMPFTRMSTTKPLTCCNCRHQNPAQISHLKRNPGKKLVRPTLLIRAACDMTMRMPSAVVSTKNSSAVTRGFVVSFICYASPKVPTNGVISGVFSTPRQKTKTLRFATPANLR